MQLGYKIRLGVLPQLRAPETAEADKLGVSTKRSAVAMPGCNHGFATGDMVKAVVPSGKKAGIYRGRVAVRKSGSFNIQTPEGVIQGIGWRHCRLLSHNDGYGYAWLRPAPHSSPV